MDELKWAKRSFGLFLLCAATAIALAAQTNTTTFTTLHSFDGTDGSLPYSALVQATDGNLYGTTQSGGASSACNAFSAGCGTVFKITPSGTLTTLQSFDSTDGAQPLAELVQGTDGNFYGTTLAGGANNPCFGSGCGTVFKITPTGALTTLYSFCSQSSCADGDNPYGGLIQASNGGFYGATPSGGDGGAGTIFKITPSGHLKTLCSSCGSTGALLQASDGNFYGTTDTGGAYGFGSVFKITPSGTVTTLYSFCSQHGCPDGQDPMAGLVQDSKGNFYGTTYMGGTGRDFNGTVFKITPSGTLTTLYSFCSQIDCTDGANPYAGVVQGTDGNLYGTTQQGGSISCQSGCGTVFKITPSGTLKTLYAFDYQIGDGVEPLAGLVQDTNGKFYGTTAVGGAGVCFGGCGTAFSLSVGLEPFVKTQTTSGKVGAAVKILGTNLTGASSVTFNGTAATFTVKSASLIATTVPSGATTGTVQVVTPSGTLSSNVPFRVLP